MLVLANAYARRDRHREERTSLQREIQDLTARLVAFESQFPMALIMMDSRGLIRRVNPAAQSLFGYTEQELLGQNIHRVLPFVPTRNPGAPRITPGGTNGTEMDVRCKDQAIVKVRVTSNRSESEEPSDFYMFFETPTAPAAAAQPPLALVERVVGRISRKFEQLLTTINGYGELALHAAPEESPLRPHLEEIVSASERASYLARNLLAFSGNQLIPVERVDLNTMALEAATEIQVPTSLDLAAQAPFALANRECLQQVIRLLAESAALRIAGKSGSLRVHTSQRILDRPRAVYSGVVPTGTYALLTISDPGAPLDAEILAHMFEPLYGNPALPGVDLSPIYGIVTSLGGRLDVESGAQGTTVEIWLPVAAEHAGDQGSQSRGAVANG